MTQSPAMAMLSGIAFVVIATAAPARAETPGWPDDFLTRVEAQALVQTLNGEFLATRSATLTLEKWCGAHQLGGAVATIKADLIRGETRPATPEQRERLKVGPDETINFRHVRLVCGDRVLSEADNWYVPARLTPQMNQLLETTTTPFGKAVLDLHFRRQNFAVTVFWSPLPKGWEMKSSIDSGNTGTLQMPQALFEHRALLFNGEGVPFSEVRETYQRALLDFSLPHP